MDGGLMVEGGALTTLPYPDNGYLTAFLFPPLFLIFFTFPHHCSLHHHPSSFPHLAVRQFLHHLSFTQTPQLQHHGEKSIINYK
ncbi:hypothetical protein K457DRAFT_842158 [Linnemannia elongata AG-77]|uniref:Uncharacterized protein n=1 Tax=Linnemannia elongata AG-77 TaxID=1314771 RepID=A0A197JGK6_9FUNG|nr:hypothetical protein K457DRAFT_842158 [Linnemannia elongata AG-77]